MISERYQQLTAEVNEASAGRDVRVLLAAKHQPAEKIMEALQAGATLLGHNIIQQLTATEEALAELGAPEHETHVIGHVQSNKARAALRHAHTIETVDSAKTARRLSTVSDDLGVDRNVFIQVNSAGAESQFGIDPEDAKELADLIHSLPRLTLTGLMTIGANTDNETQIHTSFALTRELSESLRADGHDSCTELSMGMSGDWRIAVDEGSTIIRVGRQVFGERDKA